MGVPHGKLVWEAQAGEQEQAKGESRETHRAEDRGAATVGERNLTRKRGFLSGSVCYSHRRQEERK